MATSLATFDRIGTDSTEMMFAFYVDLVIGFKNISYCSLQQSFQIVSFWAPLTCFKTGWTIFNGAFFLKQPPLLFLILKFPYELHCNPTKIK